jgi:DNA polymerase III subunit beta
MKFLCQQADLAAHLSLVGRAVSSKPSLPILVNIKLVASSELQQVQLTGFDMSLGIQTSFGAEVVIDGEVALPAKLLNDIISRLPGGSLTISQGEAPESENGNSTTQEVTVTSNTGSYRVRGMGTADYPELPEVDEAKRQQISTLALIDGMRGALIACSQDETKPILTGVNLRLQGQKLLFAATDGHRLGVVETYGDDSAEPSVDDDYQWEMTVPARALRELEKMIGSKPTIDTIGLQVGLGQVTFDWMTEKGLQHLTTRTIDGNYPDYNALIPQRFSRQVTIDRKQLIGALERIAVLADQHNNLVKFTINSDTQQLVLSVEAQDVGSGQETLGAQISGEDIEIAFNVRYLLEGLKTHNSQDITISLNGPLEQVIFSPLGGAKTTYLVMPVQIRS